MTSDTELNALYELISQAVSPEDIFGNLEGENDKLSAVKDAYRKIVLVVHPDRCDVRVKEMANDAFTRATSLYEKAQKKIEQGVYGTHTPEHNGAERDFVIQTRKREYRIKSTLAQGDLSTVYLGECNSGDEFGKVAIKVIDDPGDNDLMMNEIRTLKLFQSQPANQSKHLPVLMDQFKTSDNQLGIVLRCLDGCYDLYSVREKYKDGVSEKHMVWMFNRLLSVLGYVHSKGVTHNNIEPAHLLIRPKDHNLFLIDWSYAAINPKSGDGFKVFNEEYSPPEVRLRKSPLPSSDLYAAGKSMIYILGGDPKTNFIPSSVNDKLRRFVEFFVMESPLQRAQDAWEMHAMLNELVVELWGPKRFLEFEM